MFTYSSTVEAPQIVEMFPAYYIFNGLFSILLVLHVIWTYFIYKVAYKSLTKSVSDFFTRKKCLMFKNLRARHKIADPTLRKTATRILMM